MPVPWSSPWLPLLPSWISMPWRIPGMVEPGGLPSMGSHGVGHDWSNLAAAAAANLQTNACEYMIEVLNSWQMLFHSSSWWIHLDLIENLPLTLCVTLLKLFYFPGHWFSPISKMGRTGQFFVLSTHILVITYSPNLHTSVNLELLIYPSPHWISRSWKDLLSVFKGKKNKMTYANSRIKDT